MQDFAMSAFETLDGVEESIWALDIPRERRKQFSNILLNQLDTSKVACTLYSTWNVLCNLTWKVIPEEIRKETFDRMVSDWKMRPDFWASLDDGQRYARESFNKWAWTNFVAHKILLSPVSIMAALSHSWIATGIKFSSKYFNDEQQDWKIDSNVNEIVWDAGHSISLIVWNYTDPSVWFQIKLQENYQWKLLYNIIYCKDFETYRKLFFHTWFYFTK